MSDKNDSGGTESVDQSQKPLFSFGIIADVQYANSDPVNTRFYRSSLGKLRNSLSTLKEDSADFIINLGDLIDRDYISYKPVFDIIDSSGVKVYHIAGNHDYSVDPRLKKRLPVLSFSKKGYYSFVHKNFRFICLNGNEESTYISNNKTVINEAYNNISKLRNNGEINAVEWNGSIGNLQLTWLTNQLNDATAKKEKVFLVCHFPVYPENIHNLLNYKEVLPVLERYHNVIAWLNGHNHTGNYGYFNLIHFITFKGMVETESNNSFALVEVFKNKISVKGYGREESQKLEY